MYGDEEETFSIQEEWDGALALLDAWICPRMPRFLERWPAENSGFTPWEVWVPGVEYARANLTKPRRMKCHAIRIDLSRPEIRLKVGGEPGEVSLSIRV